MLYGAYTALFKHDIKGLLAYSTISHLGLIVLLFGIDTPLATVAGVFHIINHATFKASLFMAAGIIDHETGTRDMRRINGLWHYLPHTGTLAMVAAAAMAGVPLLNGFMSKEMFFAETLHLRAMGSMAWLLPAAATLAGIFAVAYSARFIHDVFFNGEPVNLPKYPPHEAPRYMKLPVEVLVAQCLLVGIFPNLTVAPFLALASADVLGGPLPDYSLAIWHGFNAPFFMSLTALGGGIAFYSWRHQLFALHGRLFPGIDAHIVFKNNVDRLLRAARTVVAAVENGSLQRSVAVVLLGAGLACAVPLATGSGLIAGDLPMTAPTLPALVGGVLMMAAAVVTVWWRRQRLMALVALSVVGLLAVLTFVLFSAPDLALTQLAVEVATILLLLLTLYFLPQEDRAESRPLRVCRDLGLAVFLGGGMGLVTWATLTHPPASIAGYFMDNSLPGGGGRNVVNVILVDFRGFDTLGEITVLAIAAVGIYALLDQLCLAPGTVFGVTPRWTVVRHSPVLTQITRFLLPLALMVAIYLFLRGHNAPGGGFIAGLITAIALILHYMASGIAWTQQHWQQQYHTTIAWGIVIAALTGVGSWLFGHPFLTSAFGHFTLPLIGEFELATAMLFDLGVFLTVVGIIMLILATLGKLSRRCLEMRRDL